MREDSEEEDIEKEAEWIETSLTATLDSHTTPLQITARSKRCWTDELEVKFKKYEGVGRLYQQRRVNTFTLKAVRNNYYYTIRWPKGRYCRYFRQGADTTRGDSERYSMTLRYTKR